MAFRRRCSAASPAYGAGGASTASGWEVAPRVAKSKRAARLPWWRFPGFCGTLRLHLSLGMSITLNVGAGVASAGASAASARSTARGARTAHCGARRPAAPARQSASTILCISVASLGWFAAANTVTGWPSSLFDTGTGFIDLKMLPFLTRGVLRAIAKAFRRTSSRSASENSGQEMVWAALE